MAADIVEFLAKKVVVPFLSHLDSSPTGRFFMGILVDRAGRIGIARTRRRDRRVLLVRSYSISQSLRERVILLNFEERV